MKRRISKILCIIRMSFSILILIGMIYAKDVLSNSFAVIVNSSNNVDNVSISDLLKYFSVQKLYWPNQKKVVVILPESGSEEKEVLLECVYKLSEDSLSKRWLWKVYKGEITSPPKTANSSAAAIAAVMKDEGGISVVKTEDVADNVKVLKINGKSPAEPGYPLVKHP